MGFYGGLMGFNMENHHAINGKTHYFDWAMLNSINSSDVLLSRWMN